MATLSDRQRRRLLLGGLLTAAALLGGAALLSMSRNLVYYVSPAELLARGSAAYGVPVRLGGVIQTDSVHFAPDSLTLTFDVGMAASGPPCIAVVSQGTPPQMFHEGSGAVVEGRFDGARLRAERLMVKHSNEYRPPAPGEAPQRLFTTLKPPADD